MYSPVRSPDLDNTNRALDDLRGVLTKRLDWRAVPFAVRGIITLILSALGLLAIPKDKVKKRPRIDTLLDACRAMIAAKQSFDTDKDNRMASAVLDLPSLTYNLGLISALRETMEMLTDARDGIYANLAERESEMHAILIDAYENVRPLAMKDADLRRALAPMEKHVSEAAERGAERSSDNKGLRSEAYAEGFAAGQRAAQENAENLKKTAESALDAKRPTPPAPQKDDRGQRR